jgi:hypothetical protein
MKPEKTFSNVSEGIINGPGKAAGSKPGEAAGSKPGEAAGAIPTRAAYRAPSAVAKGFFSSDTGRVSSGKHNGSKGPSSLSSLNDGGLSASKGNGIGSIVSAPRRAHGSKFPMVPSGSVAAPIARAHSRQ